MPRLPSIHETPKSFANSVCDKINCFLSVLIASEYTIKAPRGYRYKTSIAFLSHWVTQKSDAIETNLHCKKQDLKPVDMFPQSRVCIRVTCKRHWGVDMFPHTSKSRFSSFSEESEPILGKEKRVLTFLSRSKLSILLLSQEFFLVSATIVSTCIV